MLPCTQKLVPLKCPAQPWHFAPVKLAPAALGIHHPYLPAVTLGVCGCQLRERGPGALS